MIKELIEKRARLHEENASLLARAAKDGRDVLNADEEAEWASRDQAIEALTKNIEMRSKHEAVAKTLAEVEERKTVPTQPGSPARTSAVAVAAAQRGQADMDLALRAWFLRDRASEAQVTAAQRAGIDLRSNTFFFNLSPRAPRTVAAADAMEFRAQSTASIGAGGAVVPDDMMRELEKALLFFGGMRQVASVIRTTSGADLPWPTVNDTTVKGRIVGQNAATAPTDAVFAQTVFKSFKYSSDVILVPVELMQDSAVNLPALLGELLGERLGRIQNEHFTTGGGTTLPWGVVTRAAAGVTGAAGGGITYANLVDLEHSVDVAYRRQGAAFMMNDVKLATLKKIVDGNGRPILSPSTAGIGQGFSQELLGYPVIVNNDMATAATTGTRAILFGALQKYKIRDVMGVELLRLDERYAENHQVAFLAFTRADGDLLNAGTNPVKYFAHTT